MKLSKLFIKTLSVNERISEEATGKIQDFFNQMLPWKFDEFVKLHIKTEQMKNILSNFQPFDETNPPVFKWVGDDYNFVSQNLQSDEIQYDLGSLDYIQECY